MREEVGRKELLLSYFHPHKVNSYYLSFYLPIYIHALRDALQLFTANNSGR